MTNDDNEGRLAEQAETIATYEATLRIVDAQLDGVPGDSRAEKIMRLRLERGAEQER